LIILCIERFAAKFKEFRWVELALNFQLLYISALAGAPVSDDDLLLDARDHEHGGGSQHSAI
jgi:hypothetical protein